MNKKKNLTMVEEELIAAPIVVENQIIGVSL